MTFVCNANIGSTIYRLLASFGGIQIGYQYMPKSHSGTALNTHAYIKSSGLEIERPFLKLSSGHQYCNVQ